MKSKKLMVTGGAGFMGSYFIKYMLKNHPYLEVVNYDALTYSGNQENLKEVADDHRYTFVQGDITSLDQLEAAVKEHMPDTIVNFAAETHVDRSIMDPLLAVRTNTVGTTAVLHIATKYKLKMLQVSTDEVFGSIPEGHFTEESPMEPNSPYSAGKAGGDLMCGAYFETYKTDVVVTHCCNVMGPNQYPEKLIPLFITNLIEGKKVPVYGDGLNVREWIYVEDHSRALEFLLEHGTSGEVYNIGTGFEKTNLEMTHEILDRLGKDESSIEYVQDRKGHDKRYAIDSSKIRAMGWEPVYDFDTAMNRIVQWYQENEDWWKKIKSGEYREYYEKQYQQESDKN